MSRGFLRLSALAVYTYMHAVVQLVATASPPSRPVQHDPTATANGTPRSVALFRQSASEEARAAQLDALQRSAAMWTDADAPSSTVRSLRIGSRFHALVFPAGNATLQQALDPALFLHVEQNGQYRASAPMPPNRTAGAACEAQSVPAALYNLDRLDQVALPLDGLYVHEQQVGSDVDIFIVDSGVRVTHDEFRREGGAPPRSRWGVNTIDDSDIDASGHGTHVAGTAGGKTYGACKNCLITSVKVLGSGGQGSLESILEGLEWIAATGIPTSSASHFIINLSLGGAISEIFDAALLALKLDPATRTHIVSAAGNENRDACLLSPARAAASITVTNSMLLGATTDFRTGGTNFGPCCTLWAPGNQITSAGSISDTASRVTGGTSMSAPLVSGVLAMYASAMGSAGVEAVERTMLQDASEGMVQDGLEDRGTPNRLLHMRCPLPNA